MNSSRQWNQEWQRNPIGRCVAGRLDADGTGVVVVVVVAVAVVQVLAVLGPARQSGVHAMWPPVLLGLCPPLAADETRVPAVPRERPTVARRTPPQLPIDPPPRTPPHPTPTHGAGYANEPAEQRKRVRACRQQRPSMPLPPRSIG